MRRRAKIGLALVLAGGALGCWVPGAGAEVPWGAGCAPATSGVTRTSTNCGAELVEGRAIAPPGAPPAVKTMVAAANHIRNRPYVWGGGHLSWFTHGYDCSGAVGYVLHAAGLLDVTMVSGQLASWGEGGAGRWISVYANTEHVYMTIAGLRFDTRSDPAGESGPRWHRAWVDPRKFSVRHAVGL